MKTENSSNQSIKTIGDAGEKEIVRHLSDLFGPDGDAPCFFSSSSFLSVSPSSFPPAFSVLAGPGKDDCAVLSLPALPEAAPGENPSPAVMVCTTDMLHRKTDFPEDMTYYEIGWMSAAVNLSDIAAMGAAPAAFLASMGLPPEMPFASLTELAAGLRDCVHLFGGKVIGGDTDRHEELTIAGTAFGFVRQADAVKRSGARPGDLVCVTGAAGAAGMALDYVLPAAGDLRDGTLCGLPVDPKIIRHLFLPCPRVFEGQLLSSSGIVTSMMDTSDGLASSLHELAEKSGVGFEIYEDGLPLFRDIFDPDAVPSPAVRNRALNSASFRKYAVRKALYDGGDFELLFTIRPDAFSEGALDRIRDSFNEICPLPAAYSSPDACGGLSGSSLAALPNLSHKYPARLSVIGRVTDQKDGVVLINEKSGLPSKKTIDPKGYTAFCSAPDP